jgi:hypothetical protein
MATMLLKDPQTLPSPQVLADVLGSNHRTFEALEHCIKAPHLQIELEWRYYNDGKAWLCKAIKKKKTVFWLSVWDDCFKLTFYFTEKHLQGIAQLPIDESIKDAFAANNPIGKLLPLTLEMATEKQLADALKIIEFKASLK